MILAWLPLLPAGIESRGEATDIMSTMPCLVLHHRGCITNTYAEMATIINDNAELETQKIRDLEDIFGYENYEMGTLRKCRFSFVAYF